MTDSGFNLDQLTAIGLLLEDVGLPIGTAKNRAVRDLIMVEAEALRDMMRAVGQAPAEEQLVAMAGRNLFGRENATAHMVASGFLREEALDMLLELRSACEDMIVQSRPAG